ncbi:MAG: 50S ribosomal protein L29 [Clostridia bacterium]|nr:50S ribosomal protein L29 [Clostridia bacterium]
MKIKDIREKTAEELNDQLRELKNELFRLRFQHAINQLDNPHKIVETRRSIAQVMTVIREKEIAAGEQA